MVRLQIEDLTVYFPYDFIYPEQYAYMLYLKRILDAKGHGVLEMPTGTGKTVSLFSLITSYQMAHPTTGKLIYCTRTVPEMEKALLELRKVVNYRIQNIEGIDPGSNTDELSKKLNTPDNHPEDSSKTNLISKGRILGLGLSARRNMCIHPAVHHLADREKIDEHCRKLTAPWVRNDLLQRPEAAKLNEVIDIEDLGNTTSSCHGNDGYPEGLCNFYENFERHWSSNRFRSGVYTIEDIKKICSTWENPTLKKSTPICPYFASRRLIQIANVVVLNYQYILDPKVSQAAMLSSGMNRGPESTVYSSTKENTNFYSSISEQIGKEPSIVVFDEAHNIDNVCIEALSITLNRTTLERAGRNLIKLADEINRTKKIDQMRITEEYEKLVTNLYRQGELSTEMFEHLASPVLPDDIVQEAIPGNIRRAEHFINIMKKIVMYLKTYIKIYEVRSEGPLSFLHNFEQNTEIESKSLKFCHDRLKLLMTTLQISNIDEFSPLTAVADYCTLVATYWEGFIIICDPYPEATGLYDPMLQLCCLDASLAIRPVLKRYQSIILTSGTISPLELYPKLLDFTPVVTESLPMSLDRNCICPLIVSKGSDQVPLSSRYEQRNDLSVIQNYGNLLIELSKAIPDGMVCFFTSYIYMEQMFSAWYELGVLASLIEHKLIFIETTDVVATTLALQNFRKACDCGRGAIFFSVARGKVAEGIDFDRHYGRCVILFGVPYQYTLSRILKARLDYMREHYQIQENEFLTFDAMRQAAQCVGRVIRSKADYGLMIFADARYGRLDKRSKLPPWIQKFLENSNLSLSSETAVSVAKNFLKNMSQPYQITKTSLLDEAILSNQKKTKEALRQSLNIEGILLDLYTTDTKTGK